MTYYIWSHRKNSWWSPERQGYTPYLSVAGQYPAWEAADIVLSGLPGANVPVDAGLAERKFASLTPAEVTSELEFLRRI